MRPLRKKSPVPQTPQRPNAVDGTAMQHAFCTGLHTLAGSTMQENNAAGLVQALIKDHGMEMMQGLYIVSVALMHHIHVIYYISR